ncbi:MAG: hypothetical protein NC904_08775 [Candidatus Omnitrophica bacterium]|nr:hypothetical protein [Candidatus Omnitrophota bacterium]
MKELTKEEMFTNELLNELKSKIKLNWDIFDDTDLNYFLKEKNVLSNIENIYEYIDEMVGYIYSTYEFIYYDDSLEYLSNNDSSLIDTLYYLKTYDYRLESLNSIVDLANVHLECKIREIMEEFIEKYKERKNGDKI